MTPEEEQEVANLKADVEVFKRQRDWFEERVKILEEHNEQAHREKGKWMDRTISAEQKLKRLANAMQAIKEIFS